MASIKISKIELKNFKSYGEEVIENLDDKINVFVGKNGHGKSNIHHGKTHNFLLQFWSFKTLNLTPVPNK